jgi:hypothetical protein
MCLICTEWQKGNLTAKEAFRNLGEQLNVANDEDDHETVEHLLELSNKIMDAEVPYEERDMQSEAQMEDMLQDYEYRYPANFPGGDDE